MDDDAFVNAVRSGTIAEFHHRDHLRLTFIILGRTANMDQACEDVGATIRSFAALHGQAAKYHETITRFWVEAVAYAMALHPTMGTFDDLTAAEPHLLDKNLIHRHWSSDSLWSEAARGRWVGPNLAPVPWSTAGS